jgi:hypothetical protein
MGLTIERNEFKGPMQKPEGKEIINEQGEKIKQKT